MHPEISQKSQTFGSSFGVGATAFGTGATGATAKFAAPTGADVMVNKFFTFLCAF